MPCCVDFGIINTFEPGKNYSELDRRYSNPYQHFLEEYRCISVPDDIVNEWIVPSQIIPTYLESSKRDFKGIDHYGITLLPPTSLPMLLEIVKPWKEADESVPRLIQLIQEAIKGEKYMIVYGV